MWIVEWIHLVSCFNKCFIPSMNRLAILSFFMLQLAGMWLQWTFIRQLKWNWFRGDSKLHIFFGIKLDANCCWSFWEKNLFKQCIVWVGNRVTPMHELMELNEDDLARKKQIPWKWLRTVAHLKWDEVHHYRASDILIIRISFRWKLKTNAKGTDFFFQHFFFQLLNLELSQIKDLEGCRVRFRLWFLWWD